MKNKSLNLINAFLSIAFLLVGFQVSAQKSVVLAVLTKHGLDKDLINPRYFKQPDNYAYDLQQTTKAVDKTTALEAKYNPALPEGEKWTIVSVDGKSPSKGDIKTFTKSLREEKDESKPLDESFRVEDEKNDYLLLSYKVDPSTLSKETNFMKDCRMFLRINLTTKRLESSSVSNEKPIKIKMLTADKFVGTAHYKWDEREHRYFTVRNELQMNSKFLGQHVNIETYSEYSNFEKK